MPYVNNTYGIAYYPVHKCANTTMKYVLYDIESLNDDNEGAEKPEIEDFSGIHREFPQKLSYKFGEPLEGDQGDYFKFAIVRDPVSRIFSMFKDKVVTKKIFTRPRIAARLEGTGLSTEPPLSEFLENFDTYRGASRTVAIHSHPLHFHLGKDAAYYDHLYPISKVSEAVSDLSEKVGVTLNSVSLNATPKTAVEKPNKAETVAIKTIFEADYTYYGRFFEEAETQ